MTSQEIIKAIESLTTEDRDSLIEQIRQQQQAQRQAEISVDEEIARHVDKSSGGTSSSQFKYHFPELTPAEIAQRAEKVKRLQERDKQIRLNMTPEELEQSTIAFEILDESLRAARGLNGNWE